jgi:hypothetical protein
VTFEGCDGIKGNPIGCEEVLELRPTIALLSHETGFFIRILPAITLDFRVADVIDVERAKFVHFDSSVRSHFRQGIFAAESLLTRKIGSKGIAIRRGSTRNVAKGFGCFGFAIRRARAVSYLDALRFGG